MDVSQALESYLHGEVSQEVLINLSLQLFYLLIAFLAGNCVRLVGKVFLPFTFALLQKFLYLVAEPSTCAKVVIVNSIELRELNTELYLVFFRVDLLVETMFLEVDMGKTFVFILFRINEPENEIKVSQ